MLKPSTIAKSYKLLEMPVEEPMDYGGDMDYGGMDDYGDMDYGGNW